MGKRQNRHDAIREIIRTSRIKTQKQLSARLREMGHACTQATMSRDVEDMGLIKDERGYYALPEELHLAKLAKQLVIGVQYACNIVVVKTQPGAAQGVSAALDAAALKGALGTVAGDDTIMIAATSDAAAETLSSQIDKFRA